MKNARGRNKKLVILATALLLLAIPISLFGLDQVNDIRNRAEEELPVLSFETDLQSEEFTTAYTNIPYEKTVTLGGDFAPIGSIHLGCDPEVCGELCTETEHNPPEGFTLAADNKTLLWDEPGMTGGQTSWPITVSATAPSETSPDTSICIAETFNLSIGTKKATNDPPNCTVLSAKKLDAVPESRTIPLLLKATDTDSGIASVEVTLTPETGDIQTLSWTFDDSPEQVLLNKDSAPSFSFDAETIGRYTLSARTIDTDGSESTCQAQDSRSVNIVIPGDNGSPVFNSDPYSDSDPDTNLNTGTSYTYTVEAEDPNGDNIDYYVINNTGWLNFTLNDNFDGEFRGTFSGTPTAAGSYTAAIALNDGYHDHYTTQIWVINVNSDINDIPQVTIELPESGSVVQNNQQVRIQWAATDTNLITNFDVFLASDPTDESTYKPLSQNLGYNYNAYMWNTGNTAKGTYYIVVKATDNQDPPGVGKGVSGPIGLGVTPTGTQPSPQPQPEPEPEPEPETPDIIDSYPTITNITPPEKSEIYETRPIISADLTAAKKNTIKTGTVEMRLDDEDISGLASLQGGDEYEGSLIFTPPQPLSYGSHKVSIVFEDTSDQTATKVWTFTIEEEETSPDDTPDEDDEEYVTFFGFEIPRRIAVILGIGTALLVLALLIPWLFYAAWRRSRDTDWEDDYVTTPKEPDAPEKISAIAAQPAQPAPLPVEEIPQKEAPAKPSPEEHTAKQEPALQVTPPVTPPEIPQEKPPITPTDGKPPTTWAQMDEPEKDDGKEETIQPTVDEELPEPQQPPGQQTPDSQQQPQNATQPESGEESTTNPDIDETEEELLDALQQIAKEQGLSPTEESKKEPQLKEDESLPGKPPLRPSDLGGISGNDDPRSKDLDEDQFTGIAS